MGISILWIYLFHAEVSFPDQAIFLPLKFIKGRGYGAVDIFIFLSGFGLMYGAKKHRIGLFYKRRLLRIFPGYALAVLLSLIIDYILKGNLSLSHSFLKITSLWFWTGKGLFMWYISAISALYLLFPILSRSYTYSKNKNIFPLCSILATYIICMIMIITNKNYYLIFWARVPVFILGVHIGYNMRNETPTSKYLTSFPFIFLTLIFSLALLFFFILKIPLEVRHSLGLNIYPFIFIVYPLLICISRFIDYIASKESNLCRSLMKSMRFLGVHSLEIYLLHEDIVFPIGEKLISILSDKFLILTILNKGSFFEYGVFFITTIFLAYLLRTMVVQQQDHNFSSMPVTVMHYTDG